MKKEEEISFEDKIIEAKKHLEKLMNPDITLSNSVKEYKEGLKQLEIAQKLLDDAKLHFEVIEQ